VSIARRAASESSTHEGAAEDDRAREKAAGGDDDDSLPHGMARRGARDALEPTRALSGANMVVHDAASL